MSTVLLARAARADDKAKLKTMPRLRRAAATVACAVTVLMDTPVEELDPAVPVSVAQAWERIEKVVTREDLAKALVDLAEVLPKGTDEDAETAWRAQLLDRYATVRGLPRCWPTSCPGARPGPGSRWWKPCGSCRRCRRGASPAPSTSTPGC